MKKIFSIFAMASLALMTFFSCTKVDIYEDVNNPLPVTEIIPHNEYFDYEAKYLGKSDEVCPAQITEEQAHTIREQTRRIYQHFGCRGLIRCDYIMTESGKVYFLEINPVPGMTKMSLVPAQIRAAGLSVSEVMDVLIDEALSA